MLCYIYYLQSTSECPKQKFSTTRSLVDFLNERIGMKDVYTSDMIQNYFNKKRILKKQNPLLSNLYLLTRDRSKCKAISTV